MEMVGRRGLCPASGQPKAVALAAPIRAEHPEAHYVLNLSVSASVISELSPDLLALVEEVERVMALGPL